MIISELPLEELTSISAVDKALSNIGLELQDEKNVLQIYRKDILVLALQVKAAGTLALENSNAKNRIHDLEEQLVDLEDQLLEMSSRIANMNSTNGALKKQNVF